MKGKDEKGNGQPGVVYHLVEAYARDESNNANNAWLA
jgi:hypothetical protein